VEEVAALGPEQERFEAWVMREVAGRALPGLYPPDDKTRARYVADKPTP
jgi:hypothetical protein